MENEKLKRNKVITVKLEEELVEAMDLISDLFNSIDGNKTKINANSRSNMIRNAIIVSLSEMVPSIGRMIDTGKIPFYIENGRCGDKKLTAEQIDMARNIYELFTKTEIFDCFYHKYVED